MKTESGPAEPIYIVYQTTNKLNGFIYVGVHKTYDLNDGYIGSGRTFRKAVKKFGKENFTREVLFTFKTRKEAEDKEREIVNEEFLRRPDVYNRMIGGGQFDSTGMATAIDSFGNKHYVSNTDPRYLSGELKSIIYGTVNVKDRAGTSSRVSVNDPRYLSGELTYMFTGHVVVRDIYRECLRVSVNDPRYLSGELKHISTGKVNVRNAYGEYLQVTVDDPRYVSGELVTVAKGRILSDTTKKLIGKANAVRQAGSRNSCYGLMWITNEISSIRIKNTEDIPNGWRKGRTIKNVREEELESPASSM